MGNFIGYANIIDRLDPADITATSEDSEYTADRVTYWEDYLSWKTDGSVTTASIEFTFSTPRTVDSVGIFGHNVGTLGGTITWQYSTDGGTSWVGLASATPSDDSTIFLPEQTSTSAADWRVRFTGISGQVTAVHVFFGQALKMRRTPGAEDGLPDDGFIRPKYAYAANIRNSQAVDGGIIGRSILERPWGRTRIKQSFTDPAWTDSDWHAFWVHMREDGCYWVWDSTNHPDEAAFTWADGTPPPIEESELFNVLDMPVVVYL